MVVWERIMENEDYEEVYVIDYGLWFGLVIIEKYKY